MEKPLHVLQRGQQLFVRFDAAGQVAKNLQRMKLLPDGGNPYASVYVTFVDSTGVSLYITRGPTHGGDMEAFLAKEDVSWQAYFSPSSSFATGYAASRHYTRRFPLEFI